VAAQNQRRIEDVLADWLDRAITELPVDELPDQEVLALAESQLAPEQQAILSELLMQNRGGTAMVKDASEAFFTVDDLSEVRKYVPSDGIEAYDIEGPPPLAGTVCKIDLSRNEFRVFPFQDLINKSLHPVSGCFTEISVNLGASVRDFVEGKRWECKGHETYPGLEPPYRDYYKRFVVASNTIQTNFIRSNGFVIVNGKVIAKPFHAPGRDDPEYVRLGVAGDYTCLVVASTKADVVSLRIGDPEAKTINPPLPPDSYGLASPLLIFEGSPARLERRDAPFRDADGRLNGDWVDWPPLPGDTRPTDRGPTVTSFTAFGVDVEGKLVMASIFEGEWGVHAPTGRGILASVMAEFLCSRYQVRHAILGGGAADTQQFIKGRSTWPLSWSSLEIKIAEEKGCAPQFRNAPVRPKPPEHARGEVEGVRGLGAIAAVLPRTYSRL
jgi:hypothetical protein